ncbi:MAG: DNA glycosylase AlkZ-like family protein [Paludibacteraceae bacterium]
MQDCAWWCGLTQKDIFPAINALKNNLEKIAFDQSNYYFDISKRMNSSESGTYFLPSYDEFLISYKSKYVSINQLHRTKAATINGIFKPIVVANGEIVGIWRKTRAKNGYSIEPQLFEKENIPVKKALKNLQKYFR